MKKRLKESSAWWAVELARGLVSQILVCVAAQSGVSR
jgi:hypothetical protein